MKTVHNTEIKTVTFLDERYYFDEKTQQYFPSVTTVLDVYPKGYGYIKWLKDLGSNADQVLKEAGDQGTLIHDSIQDFYNGKEISWADSKGEARFNLEQWKMMMRFLDFHKTYKPQVIAIEQKLVDAELGFGGTLDLVCRLNVDNYQAVWYIDWKSGNGIYKGNKIQGSAYVKIWNKQMPEQITRAGCMHLRSATRGPDKSGKVIQGEGWKIDEISKDQDNLYNLFEHAYTIWKEENPTAKPKNIVYPDRISLELLKKQEGVNK